MRLLRSLPAALAFLLLGAHLLRSGQGWLLPLPVLLIVLLVPRASWAVRSCQTVLALGALEWTRTLVVQALERQNLGEPYLRLAFILGGVALFTAGSALLLRVPPKEAP